MFNTRIRIFVSNKGVLLEEKINNELAKLEQEGYFIRSVKTDISYSGSTGYQAMGTIVYEEYLDDGKSDFDNYSIDFNPGEFSFQYNNGKNSHPYSTVFSLINKIGLPLICLATDAPIAGEKIVITSSIEDSSIVLIQSDICIAPLVPL